MPEESKRITLRVIKQYPADSVRGKQYQALKEYYEPAELKRLIEQVIWAVLGPTGSALMGSSLDEVERQLIRSKTLIAALHYSATELASVGSSQESTKAKPSSKSVAPLEMPSLEELNGDISELEGADSGEGDLDLTFA